MTFTGMSMVRRAHLSLRSDPTTRSLRSLRKNPAHLQPTRLPTGREEKLCFPKRTGVVYVTPTIQGS